MKLLAVLLAFALQGCAYRSNENGHAEVDLTKLLASSASIKEPLPNKSNFSALIYRLAAMPQYAGTTTDGYRIRGVYPRIRDDGSLKQLKLSIAEDPCFSFDRALALTKTTERFGYHSSRQRQAVARTKGVLRLILSSPESPCLISLVISP